MYSHECNKRVRYAETDKMGYLYYGNYPLLYEIGRVEAMRAAGISYAEMEEQLDIMMPVLWMDSRYKAPALYDELLKIKTIVQSLPGKMIQFHHEIYNSKDALINEGQVKLVFVDMKTNKRISAPAYVTDKLKPYFD